MCLPSYFYDETDSHTGIFVCAAECINYEQSLIGKLFLCDFLNGCPCFFCHGMVVVLIFIGCPPNSILGVFIHNDKLVFRGTSCINTGHNVYRTKLCFLALFIACQFRSGLFFE